MTSETSCPANRLIDESSPYLRQHAHNPVDWHPWGEKALTMAREQQRPIFLSIGYSACHWCHVMEHESFENPEIATLMNAHFINIKVDREERPDLDQIYMQAVQLMTGRGGWPMSVFLTPDLKPFYGGTYWPPTAGRGMPGFREILRAIHEAWTNRKQDVLEQAGRLTEGIVESLSQTNQMSPLNEDLLRAAARKLRDRADRRHGGFGHAPKFPHAMDVRVLLRCWKRFQDADALEVVRLTLDKMAAGGMYDHLGGGFHRYSTDERWLAPHFEKMLYDNALLVPSYLEAWQATGHEAYLQTVRETLDYVLREMTHPEGGFYSTQDADSEGVEGKFFVWREAEILELLGPEEGRIFNVCYDVTTHGNWEETNILNLPRPLSELSMILGRSEGALRELLARCRQKLFDARSQRIWPGRDDKILASWNGLMLSAFAHAAHVLQEPRYAEAAARGADFLLQMLRQPDGRLLHSHQAGVARFNAYLDDYTAAVGGLIDVHQATWKIEYLQAAVELAEKTEALFADPQGGAFFYTSHDHEALLTRMKDTQDNATPAGNSLLATAWLKLARLTGQTKFEATAVRVLEALSSLASLYPTAAGQTLMAVDFLLGPSYEIALVVPEGDEAGLTTTLQAVHSKFVPNKVIAWKFASTRDESLPPIVAPLLKGKPIRGTAITGYLCQHGMCGMPRAGHEAILAGL